MNIDCMRNIDGICNTEINEFEFSLYRKEVGGFKIRVNNIVVVDSLNTFKHFFPVEASQNRVKLGIGTVKCNCQNAIQILVALLHQHAEDLFLIVQLPVEEPDDALNICKLGKKIYLALEAAHGWFITIFELDLFQGKEFVIFSHDAVNVTAATFSDLVHLGKQFPIDENVLASFLALCGAGSSSLRGSIQNAHLWWWRGSRSDRSVVADRCECSAR